MVEHPPFKSTALSADITVCNSLRENGVIGLAVG